MFKKTIQLYYSDGSNKVVGISWRKSGSVRWKMMIISLSAAIMVQSNEHRTASISQLVPSTLGGGGGMDGKRTDDEPYGRTQEERC